MDTKHFCEQYAAERKGSNCLKWDNLSEIFGCDDLLPVWVADMEFRAADSVLNSLKQRVEHGIFGYGRIPDSYYEAYAAWQNKYHDFDIQKEELRFFTGVVPALYTLVHAFTRPKDSIMICTPVYYPFYDAILNTGRKLVTCELVNQEGIYSIDFSLFEQEIKSNQVRAFIMCSPHNPVGRVWTKEELSTMLEICKKNNVLVISDEIHADFVHGEHRFLPAAMVDGGAYRSMLITLNSASKTFNLAGVILSHTVIQDEKLRKQYDDYIKTQGQPEANAMGLVACEAAYRGGREWLEHVKAVVFENYQYVKEEFEKRLPDAVITPLEGTYLTWIDLRKCIDPELLANYMTEKCHLAVDVGEWFGLQSKGFIRMNLATDPKYIKIAADSIINNM